MYGYHRAMATGGPILDPSLEAASKRAPDPVRIIVGLVCELVGLVMVAVAAFLVATALGLVVTGVMVCLLGWTVGR